METQKHVGLVLCSPRPSPWPAPALDALYPGAKRNREEYGGLAVPMTSSPRVHVPEWPLPLTLGLGCRPALASGIWQKCRIPE